MCRVCPSWLSFILYNPIRRAFTDREQVLEKAGVRADSVVLEIGAGNGFFTEAIAERAKKVIAVELQPGMVRKLRKRIQRYGGKVEIIRDDIGTADLGDEIADVCFLYYSFHEVKRQSEAAKNISRSSKRGSVLAIYEPVIEVDERGMEETIRLFRENGFVIEKSAENLFTRFVRMRKE